MFLEKKIKKNKKAGFTLVEMLIFMFIFSITGVTFYKVFASGAQAMSNVRSRLGAIQLANEKIETIHNLKFEDIGTQGGIPAGDLLQTEIVSRSGKTYYVHLSVMAVDDPFDGTLVAGTDTRPGDYKQVKVIVYWENNNPAKSASMVTTISPPGVEAMYTGGILSLNVVDSSGVGISQANVKIVNNVVSPAVNADYTTDVSGNLFLPEAAPSLQAYNIQLAKNGYFPVQTFPAYPISTYKPIDVYASIVNASINQKTIVMDKASSINFFTKSPLGVAIANIDFSLAGGRKLGETAEATPLPVWSLTKANFKTSAAGKIDFSNISPGPYQFKYLTGSENDKYELLYLDVAADTSNNFSLVADTNVEANVVLASKEIDSLVVTVLNNADNTPLVGASVKLKREGPAYDVTLTTNKFGKVYFPDTAGTTVVVGEYKLSVAAPGFVEVVDKDVTVDKLTQQEIKLLAE